MSCGDGSCGLISHITSSRYGSGPRLHSGSGVIGCVGLSWNDSGRGGGGGGGGGRENYLIIYCHWSCVK